MVAPGIRQKIEAALHHEAQTGELRHRLEGKVLLTHLRSKLILPELDPVSALMGFIQSYVESVPGCIRLVTAVSKRLGFHPYAAPFLTMAEDYFLKPPEDLPADDGLEALLDEAFLAHRLLEEVNDHHIRHLQRPLLPVDMTEANIIVHHLLGDDVANQLDSLVQQTASQLLEKEYVWNQLRALPGAESGATPIFSSNNLAGSPGQVRLRLAS
jgi:hypothetical protein